MDQKLKPCPFCGSDNIEFHPTFIDGSYATPPAIGCLDCDFKKVGTIASIKRDADATRNFSDNLLINWWNRRK